MSLRSQMISFAVAALIVLFVLIRLRAFWTLAVLTTMFVLGWLAMSWFRGKSQAEIREEARLIQRINAIPIRQAATQALALLADTSLFRCVEPVATDEQALTVLAPELQSIFKRYELIEVGTGWAFVGRSSIEQSALQPDFTRIGLVAVGTEGEGEICVRAGNETVFELHSDGIDPALGVYDSIYHWIIAIAEEERRDRPRKAPKLRARKADA